LAYNRSFKPAPSGTTVKNQLVLAVGRHAWLHLPPTGAADGEFTPFGQEKKTAPASALSDGQEVEIIAWRPTGAGGVAYQIQRLSDRLEWWAPATCLRVSVAAAAAPMAK
jgi:hypothetical protein